MEAFQDGLTMFVSFAVFGMLPIVCYIVAGLLWPHLEAYALFTIACSVTGLSLFGLGAFKAKFHDKRYLVSGIETLLLGGTCAAVAYYVGRAVSQFAGLEQLDFVVNHNLMTQQQIGGDS